MNITDRDQIDAKLFEAETRVELGLHYRYLFILYHFINLQFRNEL